MFCCDLDDPFCVSYTNTGTLSLIKVLRFSYLVCPFMTVQVDVVLQFTDTQFSVVFVPMLFP